MDEQNLKLSEAWAIVQGLADIAIQRGLMADRKATIMLNAAFSRLEAEISPALKIEANTPEKPKSAK